MHVEISDDLYKDVAAQHDDVSAFFEAAARQLLDRPAQQATRFDASDVIGDLRDAAGLFSDASLRDVLKWRRSGLA